jgi:GTP 3',8-cyclase
VDGGIDKERMRDRLNRSVTELRISVTDRCNLRCIYCMPHERYEWIDRGEILTFEEIARLAALCVLLGVKEIRLTGGEPLLRHNLERLVALLQPLGLKDLSLTTNGLLLAEKAPALASAGLKRVNVSLDTLDPDKYQRITRRSGLEAILDGLFAARRCGLDPIKINTVIERGMNDDEIVELAEFARAHDFPLRFIEFMDVGNANNWNSEKTVSKREILERLHSHRPLREKGRGDASAPAVEYTFSDGRGDIGVIASVTEPFCSGCSRVRLTADGKLVTCLFSERGHDLKGLLRGGAADEEILKRMASVWVGRDDRYSQQRLEALRSPEGYQPRNRKKIEMISLGG